MCRVLCENRKLTQATAFCDLHLVTFGQVLCVGIPCVQALPFCPLTIQCSLLVWIVLERSSLPTSKISDPVLSHQVISRCRVWTGLLSESCSFK